MNHTGSSITPFQYNGQYGFMNDGNGLYYMRARYYNPEIKRFMSLDSVLGSITKPQSLNLYGYCNNNPINFVDPTGHSFISAISNWGTSVGNFFNGVNDQYVGGPLNEVNEQYISPALETAFVEGVDPQVISNVTEVASNVLDITEGVTGGAASAGFSEARTIANQAKTINPAGIAANVAADINVQAHKDQSFEQGAIKVGAHAVIDVGTGAALKGVGSVYGAGFVTAAGISPIAAGGVAISGIGKLGAICVASNEAKSAIDKYIDSKRK